MSFVSPPPRVQEFKFRVRGGDLPFDQMKKSRRRIPLNQCKTTLGIIDCLKTETMLKGARDKR